MSTMMKLRGTATAPFDWPNLSWFPLLGPSIRVEEYREGDRYVVRAELPGVDPTKDVRITVTEGTLRLDVVRKESHADPGHSEFHYGTFSRVVPLPAGLREETLTARYTDGILEITATVGELPQTVREVPVTVDAGKQDPGRGGKVPEPGRKH
ncbi:Hsp20/alpha crystallin family protein [Micromonospora echinofusca]|uniref:Hsp20 family protein n=1 Tax=Micromonospora echinofusca TaxID=47858 RepID=A0ABS3VW59_MICEH|nr:Hsp20/alpha crystallin family protein [Micromonospora echinofusca]MBO4208769.1 Hsp20 family protein [Micromonospora echinofusca]